METEAAANQRVIKVPVNFQGLSVENIAFLTSWCRLMQETYSALAWTASIFSFYFIFAL